MSDFGTGLIAVLSGIIGVTIVAVVVSKNADTADVITTGGNAFSKIVGAAVNPVSGNSFLFAN